MAEQTPILYGIPNCDTVKKARRWLADNHVNYEFHDYKKKGIDKDLLSKWCDLLGWESLVNRRGTTWRKLATEDKEQLNEARAIELMMENTSLIKRPVIQVGEEYLVGFNETDYGALCTHKRKQ